jgi:3-hydroxymyristoyl/3-hydroxydecanoyl-(acyl carrier protein) dehydratase
MNAALAVPALLKHAPGDVVIWHQGNAVTAAEITARAGALARSLPRSHYAINLCDSRQNLLVAFLAAAGRNQISLLPPSRAPQAVRELQSAYPDHCVLSDDFVATVALREESTTPLALAAQNPIAIVFTSGSTGRAQAHPKSWPALLATAKLARERFLPHCARFNVVATVPPQHMYGFETTVTLVLLSGSAVSDGRPLFPADIAIELASVPAPRVLITTPAHLRACVAGPVQFPPLELIISATATLDRELAAAAEAHFGARVCEIYGCTEAGSMASRRTVETDAWLAYPGAWVEPLEDGAVYHGRHLPEAVPLQDMLELEAPHRFRLIGRSADLVKVAGKRASLTELTRRLLEVPGVSDGVIFIPGPRRDRRRWWLRRRPRARRSLPRSPISSTRCSFRARSCSSIDCRATRPGRFPARHCWPRSVRIMGDAARDAITATIPASEPFFAGHFPGNPLVPGVAILDYVVAAIEQRSGVQRALQRIDSVKFVGALRPGEALTIELEPAGADTIRFKCRCGDRAVATGVLTLQARTT